VSRTLAYAASCAGLVALGTLGSWPLLDAPGRQAMMAAALVAFPLQVGAFAALQAGRGRSSRFLAAFVGGTLLRMAVVLAAAFAVAVSDLPPAPALLALAAFLVGMLFLEPLFLGRPDDSVPEAT
jgi:hypothetical protein